MDTGDSNTSAVHEFAIPDWYRFVFGALGIAFSLIAIVPPALVFGFGLGEKQGVSLEVEVAAKVASIVGACGAIAAGIYQFWIASRLHTKTICLDESGLWYKRIGKKNGLVRWRQVANVRDRGNQSQLDLLDPGGTVLIGIPSIIRDFSILRELVLSKIRLDEGIVSLPATFGSMRWSIAGAASSLCFIVALAISGFFIPAPKDKPTWMLPLIGTGILVVLVPAAIWEFCRHVQVITAKHGEIHLRYLSRLRIIAASEIADIRLVTRHVHKGRMVAVNTLVLSSGEELELGGGPKAEVMHHALRLAAGQLIGSSAQE